jgi:hypothetical protein
MTRGLIGRTRLRRSLRKTTRPFRIRTFRLSRGTRAVLHPIRRGGPLARRQVVRPWPIRRDAKASACQNPTPSYCSRESLRRPSCRAMEIPSPRTRITRDRTEWLARRASGWRAARDYVVETGFLFISGTDNAPVFRRLKAQQNVGAGMTVMKISLAFYLREEAGRVRHRQTRSQIYHYNVGIVISVNQAKRDP